MNVTRLLWSQQFMCREQHTDSTVVLILAAVFCTLPVIFYSVNRAYGARLNQKLVLRKCLK